MVIKPDGGIEIKEVSRESALFMAAFYAAIENRYYTISENYSGKPFAEVSPQALRKLKNEKN